MALSPEDMRFALNDARERHKATVDLIGRIDQQALSLLQLYVTLAGAGLTGAGVILLAAEPAYSFAVGVGLIAFALPLMVGAVLCVATIWAAPVNLPGRDAEFWQWANEEGVAPETVYSRYLTNLAERGSRNRALNARMSRSMSAAKIAGTAAPAIGLLGAIAANACGC